MCHFLINNQHAHRSNTIKNSELIPQPFLIQLHDQPKNLKAKLHVSKRLIRQNYNLVLQIFDLTIFDCRHKCYN